MAGPAGGGVQAGRTAGHVVCAAGGTRVYRAERFLHSNRLADRAADAEGLAGWRPRCAPSRNALPSPSAVPNGRRSGACYPGANYGQTGWQTECAGHAAQQVTEVLDSTAVTSTTGAPAG